MTLSVKRPWWNRYDCQILLWRMREYKKICDDHIKNELLEWADLGGKGVQKTVLFFEVKEMACGALSK